MLIVRDASLNRCDSLPNAYFLGGLHGLKLLISVLHWASLYVICAVAARALAGKDVIKMCVLIHLYVPLVFPLYLMCVL